MASTDREIWHRWDSELKFAQKDKKYTDWCKRSEKIVRRYRDERDAVNETARRYNILWSNIETLRPAVYARTPKPIVERRFMDRDPAARLASTVLERCLSVQMENGYFHQSVGQSVLDSLLAGMGQVWIRYEPKFEPVEAEKENRAIEGEEKTAEDVEQEGDGTPYEKLSYERVCVDYVYYRDFLWGPARFWCEVPWVGKRCWLTHSEIAERFYKGNLDKAKLITLDYTPDRGGQTDEQTAGYFKKAEVWEIWNKADQTAYFIAPGTPDVVLDKQDRPELKLEGFWPCPEPLFATQTNDTIVPVPDYVEYQDQAMELDDLTNRIAALTTALKVSGVYNAEYKELASLLQSGQDNRLIAVEQWAAFSEKGGIDGAISLLPLKEIADTLIGLYSARAQVKNDLFEITGMSDIVRGQGEAAETATAQRIKGQFASMRLEDRRGRVNLFCRAVIRIMAEVVSEMFGAESLMQMSGFTEMMQDDMRKAADSVPKPPQPELPEGTPPQMAQQMQQQAAQMYQQAQQQAAQAAQEKSLGEFTKAVQILKSDKLRGFRVDIETDSMIVSDAQADKEAAVELLTGTMQALTGAGPIVQAAPELMRPIGDLLMFTFRKFRVGRSVESALEDALDQINDKIEAAKGQPPPPSPDEQKAQAQIGLMQQKGQIDQQKAQQDQQQDQQKFALEMKQTMAEMQAKSEETAMELQKMREELAIDRERMRLEREKMLTTAAVDAASTQRDITVAERKSDLELQTAEAKAKAAQKPKGAP